MAAAPQPLLAPPVPLQVPYLEDPNTGKVSQGGGGRGLAPAPTVVGFDRAGSSLLFCTRLHTDGSK